MNIQWRLQKNRTLPQFSMTLRGNKRFNEELIYCVNISF